MLLSFLGTFMTDKVKLLSDTNLPPQQDLTKCTVQGAWNLIRLLHKSHLSKPVKAIKATVEQLFCYQLIKETKLQTTLEQH